MAVTIGHASIDENNRIQGGTAGDQTGREVCTRSYYMHKKGWYLLRPKSADVAEKIASAMIEACKNNKIGYDQTNRTGVITKLRSYKTIGNIKAYTECDCSSLVRACCIQVGFDPGNFTTVNEADTLEKSGYFEKRQAVTSTTVFYPGDVLVTKTKGHTVIVVSGDSLTETKTSTDNKINTVAEVQTWLNTNYNTGLTVDGVCGKNTKKALIKALQTELNILTSGVTIDGIFGNQTKNAIVNLKRGYVGGYTKVLQAMLICKGYTKAYLDGDFGTDTENALKAYQKTNGLKADGIAGKNTFAKLCV